MEDFYFTIKKPTEAVLFKDKNSKFYGYVYPVTNEEQIKGYIIALKKEHHAGRHWCYAYQIGNINSHYRTNDDGEPNNSAGMPIYGQIQSFNLTNVLVVVVRYFGGVKLGMGGLIQAYKTTAQMAIEISEIVKKTINQTYEVCFEYKNIHIVMRIVKEYHLKILKQDLNEPCKLIFEIRLTDSRNIETIFEQYYEIKLNRLND